MRDRHAGESSSPASVSSRRSASGSRRRGSRSLAGKSGIGPITLFDMHRLRDQVRRRGEGLRADASGSTSARPSTSIGSCSSASPPAQLALDDAGLARRRRSNAERVGALHRRGPRRRATIERHATRRCSRRGRGAGSRRTSCPTIIVNMAPGHGVDPHRREGAEHVARVGLLDGRALDRRGDARDPARRRRRHDRRRLRGDDHAARRRRLQRDARAVDAQRRAAASASRPFDKDRDGFVIGEGAGVLVLEELEHAQEARRADLRRAGRLRRDRRTRTTCVQPPDERRGRAALHEDGARATRKLDPSAIGYINAHGTSTDASDMAETLAVKAVFGDHAQEAGDVVDQVDDRPHARRGRRHRGGDHGAGDRARRVAADDQLREAGSRVRSRLRAEHGARGCGSTRRCRTASASAAPTRRSSSRATRATRR